MSFNDALLPFLIDFKNLFSDNGVDDELELGPSPSCETDVETERNLLLLLSEFRADAMYAPDMVEMVLAFCV